MIVGATSQILPVTIRDATTGQGFTTATAAGMSGQYTINGAAAVALSFSAGSPGDVYSSGKFAYSASSGGYLYHFPDNCFATAGTCSFVFQHAGALDSLPVAIVEIDWVRLGVSNKYTNTESNPGSSFDSVTVTNN